MRKNIKLINDAPHYAEALVEVLQSVYDPDLELDIYNLGLVYEISVDSQGYCQMTMTFTSMGCTCVETLPNEIERKVLQIDGIHSFDLKIVWTPVWNPKRISRVGRITLGINPN